MTARVLVVHHTVSPSTSAVLDALVAGARHPAVTGVDVVLRPALLAGPVDVLESDAYLIAGPVNLGYLAGALKHFFDTVYYPCRDATRGRPYAAVLHAGGDATGGLRALDAITTGLGWRPAQKTVVLHDAGPDALALAKETGAVLAALVAPEVSPGG